MNPDYVIFFDGGCTSNPGRLAVGAVVCDDAGQVITELARDAGDGTNNVSEYRALEHAICMANLVGSKRPMFVSDSKVVVQQINGYWAMRGDPGSPMVVAHSRCWAALMRFDEWKLKHVPRERNRRADWIVSRFLGHARTLKKVPPVDVVADDGEGRPGWSSLPQSVRRS